jgi:hypothetical protein
MSLSPLTADDVIKALKPTDKPLPVAALMGKPGFFAYTLRSITPDILPGIDIPPAGGGLIFLGLSENALDGRNHLTHAHSGFSTIRRSLGAILKDQLNLTCQRRAPGDSPDFYRFQDEGEALLTQWMEENLAFTCLPMDMDAASALEPELLERLTPPLNISDRQNPQASRIRALRRVCRAEAQKKKHNKD